MDSHTSCIFPPHRLYGQALGALLLQVGAGRLLRDPRQADHGVAFLAGLDVRRSDVDEIHGVLSRHGVGSWATTSFQSAAAIHFSSAASRKTIVLLAVPAGLRTGFSFTLVNPGFTAPPLVAYSCPTLTMWTLFLDSIGMLRST